jgi:hypothetical protein
MFGNNVDKTPETPRGRSYAGVIWLLFFGLVLTAAGNLYQLVRSDNLAREVALVRLSTQRDIAKLTNDGTAAVADTQQRFEYLKNQIDGVTDTTMRQARFELKRGDSQLAQNLEKKHQEATNQLAGQLSDLKVDTGTKLDVLATEIDRTGSEVKLVESGLDSIGSDVKRVEGGLDSINSAVATNAKELAVLKELGERDLYQFRLTKTSAPQKFGEIRLLLKKADAKHNRFTLQVTADDKLVEKTDRTINEPVQFYVSGNRQPYEIVVNQVKKDEVIGYVAAPKRKMSKSSAVSASL